MELATSISFPLLCLTSILLLFLSHIAAGVTHHKTKSNHMILPSLKPFNGGFHNLGTQLKVPPRASKPYEVWLQDASQTSLPSLLTSQWPLQAVSQTQECIPVGSLCISYSWFSWKTPQMPGLAPSLHSGTCLRFLSLPHCRLLNNLPTASFFCCIFLVLIAVTL